MASSSKNVGGVYTDPFHAPVTVSANLHGLKAPWLGGLRILGRPSVDSLDVVCIGCDDGIHFWTLYGSFSDSKDNSSIQTFTMDFTPKALGVGLLQCGFDETLGHGGIHFYEDDGSTIGNAWRRLMATTDGSLWQVQTQHSAFNDINGLYMSDNTTTTTNTNPFAGMRVISDRKGKIIRDELCMIGTDDGIEWWSLTGGSFTNKISGDFEIGQYKGKIRSGIITLEDDNSTTWKKMMPKLDIHALLPKE